jgi:Protein of unknown function (DUF2510)
MPDAKLDRGWYPDPDGSPMRRFWDGSRWTVYTELPPKWLDRTLARFETETVRKRSPRRWIIAAGIVTAVFVVGFGACAFVASQLPTGNFTFGPPEHVNPIPVPHASCPYLRRVHDTAVVAGEASGAARNDNEASVWPIQAARLRLKLTAFDAALRAATAHTPAPIASKLGTVREQVSFGLAQLQRARTGADWSGSTFGAVAFGYVSLNNASDLTGNACGFTVAPGADVFLNTPTTSR